MKKPTSVKSLSYSFFGVLIFLGLIFTSASHVTAQDLDVPYVPTPDNVVERMLDLTDVESSDYVIDLGSGDGRIVIAAAKRGANGHGIDLDPERIAEARENASSEGVDDQIMFMEGDIFKTDFSKASVITMYLLPSVNKKLRPELINKLEPGTQVVSHSFDMGSWKADKEVVVNNDGRSHDIYYWVIPAQTEGTWSWDFNGTNFNMTIKQRFQEISAKLTDNSDTFFDIHKAELKGKRITVRASNGDQNYIFSGRVEGDKINGMMQHHNGQEKNFYQWSATKK
ncbi:SAM-dependent methyltransferase [Aliifodinibius salipaludis]|uniref:SAM-dependent methyltransferase n=1 Tax=Fodinibius salipaludis TaxID=2032627 RepID=A0A2A2G5G7_9BACT|nr:class I SAM-dependent methyltransferase [Aliifodinibius salipaludis]PAU92881.1 SAM-dependent methyltransferase [Aliifodinibius salipaludis]